MTRPRTTEDLEELQLRARLRLERRRRTMAECGDPACSINAMLREAAAVVAALDDVLVERETQFPPQYDGRDGSIEISVADEDAYIAGMSENMERWAHGDR